MVKPLALSAVTLSATAALAGSPVAGLAGFGTQDGPASPGASSGELLPQALEQQAPAGQAAPADQRGPAGQAPAGQMTPTDQQLAGLAAVSGNGQAQAARVAQIVAAREATLQTASRSGRSSVTSVARIQSGIAAARVAAVQAAARASTARVAATKSFNAPMSTGKFTSGFGHRWGRLHAGIDLACPVGTPVRSLSSGTVTFAGSQGGYGNKVEITLWDGTVIYYGHLSSISVSKGDRVTVGQTVARSGNTGRSTGPHLHLEVHPRGKGPVDPLPWLRSRGLLGR